MKRKVHQDSWQKICRPKLQGGLGVKNIEDFNVSLLRKWKWSLLVDNHAPWSKLLTYKYGNVKFKIMG